MLVKLKLKGKICHHRFCDEVINLFHDIELYLLLELHALRAITLVKCSNFIYIKLNTAK